MRQILDGIRWISLLLAFVSCVNANAAIPLSERVALVNIYSSTSGAGWKSSTGWNGALGTECTWYGVLCDSTQSYVVNINLPVNNLTGNLPSISALTSLQNFVVTGNHLTGPIPSLSGLANLQVFDVSQDNVTSFCCNRMTGTIPSFSGLTSLTKFVAWGNQLTGTIPPLTGLTSLQVLDVDSNQLTGAVPSLTGLVNLQTFGVGGNRLTGTVPSLTGLVNLQYFSIQSNQLTGSLPSLSGLTSLQTFYGSVNQLTGPIPSLNGLTALQTFYAGGNQLTGAIPSLSGLTALQRLSLRGNLLTGSIPSLSGLNALQGFYVYNNHLTGPVPAAPPSLLPGASGSTNLCGNSLVSSGNPAIDAAWTAAQDPTVVSGGNWLACQVASTFSLTVTNSGAGTGSVTITPVGITCGATCTASYSAGTSVTLTATPAANNTFAGWSGDCVGTGACAVTMSVAKNVTATFKPIPFAVAVTNTGTPTSTTSQAVITFNQTDLGKNGSVFVTGWVPVAGLAALGISAVDTQLVVSSTLDNPYIVGQANLHVTQETLALTDASSFVLVQLTPTGWQLVINGQLIPYASGVLGQLLASQTILNSIDTTKLQGSQFCLGYGTTAAEMTSAGRMREAVDLNSLQVANGGSCNVASNPPPSSYTGLFWNAAESGWGMSITQHLSGNIFAAWYVYDATGKPIWYVMPACSLSGKTCTSDIYSVVGGTAPGVTWNGTGIAPTKVGSGTLAFSDNNTASFNFTLNGLTGTKNITRQPISTGTTAPLIDYSDLWWNANESGWGVSLSQQYGMIFVALYTYDATGKAIWYVASSCPLIGNNCTGTLYQVTGDTPPTVTWNSANQSVTPVGSISFVFTDGSIGTMQYTINGVTGTTAISRQSF